MSSPTKSKAEPKDKGSPHFPKESTDDSLIISPHADILSDGEARDVFKGKVLIDRLLVYYGKFEGSRHRAARYAQKLLDLGHIESLTNGRQFEDSVHVYRWTDVARVVNQAKNKAMVEDVQQQQVPKVPQRRRMKDTGGADGGKAVLKICIETENCQGAEIQARIRASPRNESNYTADVLTSTRTLTAATEDSFFGGKVMKSLSYVTENEERQRSCLKTPVITEVTTEEIKTPSSKSKYGNKPEEQTHCMESPRKRVGATKKTSPKYDDSDYVDHKNLKGVHLGSTKRSSSYLKESQGNNSTTKSGSVGPQQLKNATNPTAVVRSPGPGVATEVPPVAKERSNIEKNKVCGEQLTQDSPQKSQVRTTPHVPRPNMNNPTNHAKHLDAKAADSSPSNTTATQTSEKSILNASMLYNGTPENAKTSAERTKKRTRFVDDRVDNLEETSLVNGHEHRSLTDLTQESTGVSLFSSDSLINDDKLYENDYIPLSPLPPSPMPPMSPLPTKFDEGSNMKSLFWSKITCQENHEVKTKLFWKEVEGDVMFDEDEFEKLFQKPLASPQHSSRSKGGDTSRSDDKNRTLKVLAMERSRQVGIRANSVRLPIEEIHDAIVTMDDTKLDADALQALYDVRPSPEELDDIADALKRRPNAILDKPEQFVMMLAMIPSLNERLQCWIFAKRFPDRMVDVHEQLTAWHDVCSQIMQSDTLRKALEIILMLGNKMNRGTQRGNADGYHLEILPKLKDVKSQDGGMTLLQYVVKIVREQLKLEGKLEESVLLTPRCEDCIGIPDQMTLTRATTSSLPDLADILEETAVTLEECKNRLLPSIAKESTTEEELSVFKDKLEAFLEQATEKMREQAKFYQETVAVAEKFHKYFVPESATQEMESCAVMLKSIHEFCEDYRSVWMHEERIRAKEEFYRVERGRRERKSAIVIRSTPSALKERFMERRKKDRGSEKEAELIRTNKPKKVVSISIPGEEEASTEVRSSPFRSSEKTNGVIPRRVYKFEDRGGCGTPVMRTPGISREVSFTKANENSTKIERRMQELNSKRQPVKTDTSSSILKQNMIEKRQKLLKAKTC
ncbi:uncharacterized protein LOC108951118 [Ciona intestinalis]